MRIRNKETVVEQIHHKRTTKKSEAYNDILKRERPHYSPVKEDSTAFYAKGAITM